VWRVARRPWLGQGADRACQPHRRSCAIIANVIALPEHFESQHPLWTNSAGLVVAGRLEKLDGVIHVRADGAMPLPLTVRTPSYDFH